MGGNGSMENQSSETLIVEIEKLTGKFSKTTAKMLGLDLTVRLVKRLDSFSSECEECRLFLNDIREFITKLERIQGEPTKEDCKAYKAKVNAVTSHLQKKHGLVTDGYYTGMYMSTYMLFGVSLGLVFGLTVYNNISLGLPIGIGVGMALGVAIGSGKDAEAKKKGQVI
jgi:hypothetical protein